MTRAASWATRGGRLLSHGSEVHAGDRDVNMRVDQARHQRAPSEIDDALGLARDGAVNLEDRAVADQNRVVAAQLPSLEIQYICIL